MQRNDDRLSLREIAALILMFSASISGIAGIVVGIMKNSFPTFFVFELGAAFLFIVFLWLLRINPFKRFRRKQ